MTINLLDTQPIGQWDINEFTSQLEFQFGVRLIYVQYPKETGLAYALQAAQMQIQQIWDEMQNAISYSEAWFRAKHPEFWSVWDKATAPYHPLIVYSIHFSISEAFPYYHIACDPAYDFKCIIHDEFDLWQQEGQRVDLPFFSSSDSVFVRRVGRQQFELRPC